MPLSTFDGEPVTRHHYDPDGNLTGTTVIPGWTDDDRAFALGLALREANQCPRGHHLPESADYDVKWEPQPPIVCFACLALEAAAKKHENDPRHRAMLHPLAKKPRPNRSPKRRRG